MSTDLYERLNVSKTATQEEIKKAFRKLSMQHHPDKNPDNKESEESFKKIQEAYSVLSNPEKRSKYDQFGMAALDDNFRPNQGNPFSNFGGFGFDFSDFAQGSPNFDDLFGNRRPKRKQGFSGKTINFKTQVPLEDIMNQKEIDVEFDKHIPCKKCGGTGASKVEHCGVCAGTGTIKRGSGFFSIPTTCQHCQGTGEITKEKCSECNGSRIETVPAKLKVKLDSKINDGSTIRLKGAGHEGLLGGHNGDVHITFKVLDDPYFKRIRGSSNLSTELEIPMSLALSGGHAEFQHLDGKKLRVKIPKFTESGSTIRLRGAGLPNSGGTKGDLIILISLILPKNLSREQKKQLEEMFKGVEPQLKQL